MLATATTDGDPPGEHLVGVEPRRGAVGGRRDVVRDGPDPHVLPVVPGCIEVDHPRGQLGVGLPAPALVVGRVLPGPDERLGDHVRAVGDRVVRRFPADRVGRAAVEAENHQLGVGRHAGADAVGPVPGDLAGNLRSVGPAGRLVVVVAEVPAPGVVDVAVGVVIEPVAGHLVEVGPDVVGQVGVVAVHPRVQHGDDHAGAGVAQLVPDPGRTHRGHLAADRRVRVGSRGVATGRAARGDAGARCGCARPVGRLAPPAVVQDPAHLGQFGQARDQPRRGLQREAVDAPEHAHPARGAAVPLQQLAHAALAAFGKGPQVRDDVGPALLAVHSADLAQQLTGRGELLHQQHDGEAVVRIGGRQRLAQRRRQRAAARRDGGSHDQRGESAEGRAGRKPDAAGVHHSVPPLFSAVTR